MGHRILMVATELAPVAKTGGLGDVIFGLSNALGKAGHNVRVFLPYFKSIINSGFKCEKLEKSVSIPMGEGSETGEFVRVEIPGAFFELVCLSHDEYFGRDGIYVKPGEQVDYPDNNLRFAFFAKAALEFCKQTRFKPNLIHAHDWQGGLSLALKKLGDDNFFSKTASIFTVHNLGYQGCFDSKDQEIFSLPDQSMTEGGLLVDGKISLLKAGLAYADAITAVSEKYAEEILTDELGFGMQPLLRARQEQLFGIINGVDYTQWDPASDTNLAANYTAADLGPKLECKKEILEIYRLRASLVKAPLFGVVSRMVEQKGLDLVLEIAEDIIAHSGALIVLGQGDPAIEQAFTELAQSFPKRISVKIDYDENLAHKIEASADFFLMPSRFEPCGLNQMYSLRYGTVPIVRAVGGLDDTVKEFYPKTKRGNGLKFQEHTPEALLKAIAKGIDTYLQPEMWDAIRQNGMKEDFSWRRQAKRYVSLYNKTLKKVKG